MARRKVQEERKLQILKALDSCLQEKSFEKTSIKDIARVAGVNHGVLHYYFSSKEDILLNYIDYVIYDYQAQLQDWLVTKDVTAMGKKELIREIFGFINHKITLNQGLSRLFVEIWEIGLYNEIVRKKIRQAYGRWVEVLSEMIGQYMEDKSFAFKVCIAMIAFWEGMSLFSVMFDRDGLDIEEVLEGFQQKVLEII
jgi:AcrR family transcriptional regulator